MEKKLVTPKVVVASDSPFTLGSTLVDSIGKDLTVKKEETKVKVKLKPIVSSSTTTTTTASSTSVTSNAKAASPKPTGPKRVRMDNKYTKKL